jgi:hypothetical protein
MRNMYRALSYICFGIGVFGTFLFCAGVFMLFTHTGSPDLWVPTFVMLISYAFGIAFWEVGRNTKDVG